jgi:hypothetical protein
MQIKTEVFEVAGRIIVKVATGGTEAVCEVGEKERVEDAYEKALRLARNDPPTTAQTSTQPDTDNHQNDFPTDDEDPVPEPTSPQPLAKSAPVQAVPNQADIETKPNKQSGKVDNGLVVALRDACESERVQFRQPASNEQASEWIRGIREDGWSELPEAANG